MGGLYKGFVATKGKRPTEPYKGRDSFKSYAEVKDLPEFGGVLQDDSVMIDIDDADQAERLMTIIERKDINCRVTCTSRGKHFTFKNSGVRKCGTHVKLACGLIADVKVATDGKGCVEVLKVDGKERFCEWGDENPETGDYDQLPKWLFPVSTKIDFLTTSARNSDMFGYIVVLQTQLAMNKEECRECIRIINEFVVPEPLEQSELDVVLRDESFDNPIFFEGNKFQHDRFANWLISQYYIKRINGQLHIYNDGIYTSGYRQIEFLMLKAYPQMKDSQRREVLKYLEVICGDNVECAEARYIAFENGIFDIATDTMRDFSPEFVITNQIPWDYDPSAHSDLAKQTIENLACGDAEIVRLLEECIGYCFYRRNELSQAIFLTGEGANGKSTFLQMLQDVLGQQNVSALGIEELDERFSVASMFGKLANIGDDISDDFLYGRSVAHFKKIVSGNMIKAENKGQDAFFYKPTVKLIFSANQIPRTKDHTGAVQRRMVIIPFLAKFSKDDPGYDAYIVWKLKTPEVMEYLCKVGIEGLKRVIKDPAGFSPSTKVSEQMREYAEYNDPVRLFLQEYEEDDILGKETKLIHSKYEMFCRDNGYQSLGLINFSRSITRQLNCTTTQSRVNNTRVRVFVRDEH